MSGPTFRKEFSEGAKRATGTRWCQCCRRQRPLETFRIPRGVKTMRCGPCADATERRVRPDGKLRTTTKARAAGSER